MFRLICCLSIALVAQAVVTHAAPWTAIRGSATPDPSVLHDKKAALLLEPGASGEGPVVHL